MKKENKIEIKKRESICYLQILIMITAVFAFAYLISAPEIKLVSAEVTSCCEKTTDGAWCQNADASKCASGYQSTPTSCDSTSYCKLGCCYDSQEGLCMENTPEKVCSKNNGTWADSASCSIPQCDLGCCVLNGQAAFTTLTRCKKLSAFYSISTDFRNNIDSEVQCISLASLEDRGACVYDVEYSKTCKFTTRQDCSSTETSRTTGNLTLTSNATFYKDTLCSSEELATNCGPSENTICSEGLVYFTDTCGNTANIYDSSKIKDKTYWKVVIAVEDSCGYGKSNANSASCGNCDYLQGSRCGDYSLGGSRPTYGDSVCRDLNCKINGVTYNHGETFCSTDKFNDSVGSRYFRHICSDGEEIIEPCADFRNQVCTQDTIKTTAGDFLQGACTVNRWQDCTSQDTKDDCLNTDQRDCKWTSKNNEEINTTLSCVPLNAPGFKFWDESSTPICNQESSTCTVTFEKGLLTGKKCTENCECLTASWNKTQEAKCEALGDCGYKINYAGVVGKSKTVSAGKQTSTGTFNNSASSNFNNPSVSLFLPLAHVANVIFNGVGLVSGDETSLTLDAGNINIDNSALGSDSLNGDISSLPQAVAGEGSKEAYTPGKFSSMFRLTGNSAQIVDGFGQAIMIAGAIQMFGSFMGLNQGLTSALSKSAFVGMMAQTLAKTLAKEWLKDNAGLAGIGVGLLVFVLTYKSESTQIVTFECNSFEAPIGGRDCEKCNDDQVGCSEYRCKSLGQACQLLNVGTTDEKCAWVNPKDVVSPIISTWKSVLTKDHTYAPDTSIRPPAIGVKILNTKASDSCLKAFSPITFGVTTDEPSQCKIDYNHTAKFEDMAYFVGQDSLYAYNHSETLNLPSPEHLNSVEPTLKNDGKYNLFIRCKDANGNYNVDEYAISFCVEKGPDVTAPIIVETNPINNAPVQFDLSSISVAVLTNEPSNCKWSRLNQEYNNMENNMDCNTQLYQQNSKGYYTCVANLTGIQNRKDNVYYFKCNDQPWLGNSSDRNRNIESFVYTIKGSQPLDIILVTPNSTTISGASNVVPVDLGVETSNGESNKGDATCYYSTSSNANFVKMFTTGTNIHSQRQDLISGDYTYYFRCVDLGGNSANSSVEFSVYTDNDAPKVVRMYQDSSKLKIITNENSSCSYSTNADKKCDYLLSEATSMPYANTTEHYAEWIKGKTYYIKCEDTSGNQPINTACSTIVSMTSSITSSI